MNLLFIQLPRLDHDVTSPGENAMLAAACLAAAVQRSAEGAHWTILPPLDGQDEQGNAEVAAALLASPADAVAATLYLWNVERTLRILRRVRRNRPGLRVVIGGPDVAAEHPLLYRDPPWDAAVVGEGEAVFPAILKAFRRRRTVSLHHVAWHRGARIAWGRRPRRVPPLSELLPPPADPINRPDVNGMAYLETNRGCPLRCAFCCYNLRRRGWSSLGAAEVGERIRILRRRGAQEIRLVDPTFNAHPDFAAVVAALAAANRDRNVSYFVELRPDTLTPHQVRRLAAAHVTDAEVGVQSTDPAVLRLIRRPLPLDGIRRGIDLLTAAGIRPTIDFMLGLPQQTRADIEQALTWFERYPDAHPQILPTLLLPGTELRDRRHEWGLRSQRLPPYRVIGTPAMPTAELAAIEHDLARRFGGFDAPTRRFVSRRLPDLFAAQIRVDLDAPTAPATVSNRCGVRFAAADFFARRAELCRWVRAAVRSEPDILWQFVLEPLAELPLDVLDDLIDCLRRLPSHWLDRLVAPAGETRLVARRLFVRLPPRPAFDPEWVEEAESLLGSVFH